MCVLVCLFYVPKHTNTFVLYMHNFGGVFPVTGVICLEEYCSAPSRQQISEPLHAGYRESSDVKSWCFFQVTCFTYTTYPGLIQDAQPALKETP